MVSHLSITGRFICCLLVFLFVSLINLHGQNSPLKIKLIDEEDSSTIAHANIIVIKDGKVFQTDQFGKVEIPFKYGESHLKITHPSYITRKINPENGLGLISLNRKYRELRTIYLKNSSYPHQVEWPIIKGARYENGWEAFETDLKSKLVSKIGSINDIQKSVKIEVSAAGKMITLLPEAPDSIDLALHQVAAELGKWIPGMQNKTPIRQFFLLKIDSEREKSDLIFTVVEEKPQPIEGMDALINNHLSSITYPSEALELGIEGRVFVQFIVNEDGQLSDFKVLKGIGYGCDEEAIRAIKSSSPWIPGKQRGKPVKVRMVLPINFQGKKFVIPDNAFYKYMGQSMSYPAEARRNNIQGKVYLSFNYNSDSVKISNIRLYDNLGGILGPELQYAFESCPLEYIKPLLNGSNLYLLPAYFKLGNSEDPLEQEPPIDDAIELNAIIITAMGIDVPGVSINTPTTFNSIESAANFPKQKSLIITKRGIKSIPSEISQLSELVSLELNDNKIDKIAPEIGELRRLKNLILMNNNISELPTEFSKLEKLEVLGLAYNQLGDIPSQIISLPKLKALDLAGNQISEINENIHKLANLELLILSDNPIKQLPSKINELKKLKQLYLINTEITDQDREIIRNSLPKTSVFFTMDEINR